ncbi:hypothetical protein MNBD_ACTINO02-3010 [hydrothermal vent metagenome]|uniref:Uncharacterized protein n=1 Tax=hydrothermal vent metagenome TaxID=652676 RepID=A0A3B0TIR5_9ZZZZ
MVRFGGLDTRAVQMAQQEGIAECMNAKGFDYVPYVARDAVEPPDVGTLAQIPDPVWAMENGYGFAAIVERFRVSQDEDPNTAIVANLTASERRAYLEALFDPSVEEGGEEAGCSQVNSDELYYAVIDEQFDLQIEAFERFNADPRYVKLEEAWSRCMAAEGCNFRDRFASISESFQPRMNELLENYDAAAVAELRAEEIEIVTADIACVTPLADDLRELAAEHEKRLVEDAAGLFAKFAELEERYGSR